MSDAKPTFTDVRMKGFRQRSDVDDVWRWIDEQVAALPTEVRDVFGARGRCLSASLVARANVPPFRRSAMDGYAVQAGETFGAGPYNELEFRLVGESLPGKPFGGVVHAGEAVRIMTGAPMPAGADAVVMAEHAREEQECVFVTEAMAPGKNVGAVGEDIAIGAEVLPAGRPLRPQDLAVAAAQNQTELTVVRAPKVRLVITGNELVPVGAAAGPAAIIDTNSIMLTHLLERDGFSVVPTDRPVPILPDDRVQIRQAMTAADADVVFIVGGSSVGREDHGPSLVQELGELAHHGVALRPASPTGIGRVNGRVTLLLPGNPVSCLCAYDLFGRRVLDRLAGVTIRRHPSSLRLPLRVKIASAVGRVDYVRARIVDAGIEPLAISGASILSSATRADGYVLVPRDLEGYPAGAEVDLILYPA